MRKKDNFFSVFDAVDDDQFASNGLQWSTTMRATTAATTSNAVQIVRIFPAFFAKHLFRSRTIENKPNLRAKKNPQPKTFYFEKSPDDVANVGSNPHRLRIRCRSSPKSLSL